MNTVTSRQLVRERVEVLAEFSAPPEVLGQESVETVRERRDRENRQHHGVVALHDSVRHRVHEQYAQHAQQVRQEPQAHGT